MSGKRTSEVVRDIKKERRMAEGNFDRDLEKLWKILKIYLTMKKLTYILKR